MATQLSLCKAWTCSLSPRPFGWAIQIAAELHNNSAPGVYSHLAGYEDVNDAQRFSQDPTLRLIGSERVLERGAALTSRLQSFETEMLVEEENFAGLGGLNRALIGRAEGAGCRTVEQARESIRCYFEFYNQRRLHQSLAYRPPAPIHAA